MRVMKSSSPRIRTALLLGALGALSGCLDDTIPLLEASDYKIAGETGDDATGVYIHDILDNRLDQKIEPGEDSDAEKARRETYREEQVRADLQQALFARGYYEGRVTYQDDPVKPLTGSYQVEAGPLYHLSSIRIEPAAYAGFADKIKLEAGDALEAGAVLEAQAGLLALAGKGTCYFGLDVGHEVRLNEKAHTGALIFHVTAGPPAVFGDVVFAGQDTVKVSYLENLIPWKRGGCYRADRVERLRTRLMESGLFSRADVRLPEAPDADGNVAIVVDLKERAHRTVRAGLSYYTDEGAGGTLGWEHRNFLGGAEKLTTALTLSQIRQSLEAELLKPYFLRKDLTLSLNTALQHQDTDAFKEVSLNLGGSLERRFNRRLTGSLGTDFTLTRIEEEDRDTSTYGLVSFPGSLTFDNRDNKLDPHKGWAINAVARPYFDVLGESDPFLKAQVSASTYFALGTPADIVLAMRGSVGSIMGAGTANVPATERFYAGGGGTVRGFGYQEIGPQDGDTPTGGRSLVAASSEFRFKMSETLGAVAFVDAGSVSEAAVPDFDNLSVGAGVGLRYYTSFGPLRFDVAVPVTGKEDADQKYQIYLSIGQAF